MSNTNAYVKDVTTYGGDPNVHQSSPHWVLTFIRWAERDTLRTKPRDGITYATTRPTPLVVESDCIQLQTSMNKGTLTPSMSATLLLTDVNYLTAVAPGDFCFVNILNWGRDARRIVNAAHNYEPLNGPDDGFKGVFKIQSVRESLQVDPSSGQKTVMYKITGFAFTEFNNTIYFNPAMFDTTDTNSVALFASNMGSAWSQITSAKGITNVQDINRALIQMLIGTGVSKTGSADKFGNIKTANTLFILPDRVGDLLGLEDAKAAKDLYAYQFGIQQYAGGAATDFATGMNPSNIASSTGNMYQMSAKVEGEIVQPVEYWNQVKLWSILKQFVNAPLNELFTTIRISPDGQVLPTVVFRQIPFTNDDFNAGGVNVTRFMNLPRWRISQAMIESKDLGRDEAARINFVQVFGRATLGPDGIAISAETAQKNYLYDVDDVRRSGLRPLVVSGAFDELTPHKSNYKAPVWARIIGDTLIGGHLKLNGTIQCLGIQDPIACGDNLEDNGVVYHIESVSHACGVTPDGKKMFRTSISVSSGLSTQSNAAGLDYAEMDDVNGYNYRQNDTKNILPGISESQNVVGRKKGVEDIPQKDTSFIQPNATTNIRKSTRDK